MDKIEIISKLKSISRDTNYSRLLAGATGSAAVATTDRLLGNHRKVDKYLKNKIKNPLTKENIDSDGRTLDQNKKLRLKLKARMRMGEATPTEIAHYKRLLQSRSSKGQAVIKATGPFTTSLPGVGASIVSKVIRGGGKRDKEIQKQVASGKMSNKTGRLMRRATREANLEYEKGKKDSNLGKLGVHAKRYLDVVRSNKDLNKKAKYKYNTSGTKFGN